MSENGERRFERLEQRVARLRVVTALLAVAVVFLLAVLLSGAGVPEKLTLKRLAIADAEGRERIVAATFPDGEASLQHYDLDRQLRILAVTLPNGQASLRHYDTRGKGRIVSGTLASGEATAQHFDRDEKQRIVATTRPDGSASILLRDVGGQPAWSQQGR